jgi:hypothetical protein
MLQHPHTGHRLGSTLLTSTHLCPHFRHIHSATFHNSIQTFIYIKALNFFLSQRAFVAEKFCDLRFHRLLPVSLAAITSTFFGIKDIFLQQLGHFPSLV